MAAVVVKEARGMGAGETSAQPVGDAGPLAPPGEERQLGAVAAHGVPAEVLLLPPDVVGGGLHDGGAFPGGVPAGQGVPAVVEFPVHFRTEQGGVPCPFPAVPDAVAAYAHAFELLVGRVQDVVADVHLLVAHHLRGSEIDEWCCHNGELMKLE